MLATEDDVDPQTAAWDQIDLHNSPKMAITSRRTGWVVVMVGGDVYWLSADSARGLAADLTEAAHPANHA